MKILSNLIRTHLLHGLLAALAFQDSLAVLVELELGDNNVGGVDADRDGGTVNLLAGDTVDVDDPLLTVDLDNLAFTALEAATDDHDLIILGDRDRAGLREETDHVSRCDMLRCMWCIPSIGVTTGSPDRLGPLIIRGMCISKLVYLVLLTEFLGQSSAHDLAADARGSLEMSSAALAAGRANVWIVVGKKKARAN